jgi:diguanylate cyclase (GGDEF)-like protein
VKAPSGLAVALLESLPRGVVVIDAVGADRPVVYANAAFLARTGHTPEALVNRPLAGLIPASAAADRVAWQAALDRGEMVTVRLATAQGAEIELDVCPLRGAAPTPTHYVAIERISPAAPAPAPAAPGAESRAVPREDRLTGLCHHDWFSELFRRDFAVAAREGNRLAFFVIDVDALGAYNDTFGKQAGDSVIRRVGRALLSSLRRAGDVLAREEGGRYVALTPGASPDQARRHAETLAARVRELYIHHPRSGVAKFVTVTIGVASVTVEPGQTPELLRAAALGALGRARAEGRNRIVAVELPP